MGSKVKFQTFPDKEEHEFDVTDIEEVLQTGAKDQAGLKLRGGDVVIILHSPRDAVQMLRDADLPPLPQAEPDRVIQAVAERYKLAMGHEDTDRMSFEATILTTALAHALCDEFNRVLAEALA